MPSAVIAKIEYDQEQHCLRITYQSGSVYEYLDVPEEVYREMLSWQSRGAYLNKHIKTKFGFRKVSGQP